MQTEREAGAVKQRRLKRRVISHRQRDWCRCTALLLILGLGLGWAGGGLAEMKTRTKNTGLELEPVVVTGTVTPTRLDHTAASITVLSRERIAAQQTKSVTELLRHVPGLHIDQAGARGSVSSVYLRGSDPNFTVVLIDGIKVNDPTNSRGGSFDFSTLSPENIERIEIVRGPLSAVYGSDAMSGVINIITRRGEAQPVGSIEVASGRYDHVHTVAQARGMLGVMDYALSGSYLDNGEPVEGSDFVNRTFHVNFGLPLSSVMELRWMLRYVDSDMEAFPDDSGGPTFAVRRAADERDARELTLGISFAHEPFPWWGYRFQLGIYNRQEGVTSPGVEGGVRNPSGIPPSVTSNSFMRYDLTLRHLFAVVKGVHVAVGAQAQFEDGTSRGSLDFGGFSVPTSFALARDIWAPFFEMQFFLIPGLSIQGGIRVDFPEGFDAEVSPRVGVAYTIAAMHTTLRVNWGEGFKLPSLFSLGSPIVGNPGLVPETSRSVDAGIRQSLWEKRVTIGLTYFYHEFTNLVDFDEILFRLVNRSEVTTAGVEVSLQVQPWSLLGATAHLTYVTTDIKGTKEELRNRPEWRGGFTVRWHPLPVLALNIHALFVGEVLDSSIPTGDRALDAYARVDLAMTWTITPTWELFLGVDNLFDADYEEFVGFPAPGIRPRGGVRAKF